MLVRLLPEQVEANWEILAPLISVGVNPEVGKTRQGMVNILRSVLMEKLVCWAYVQDGKFMFLLTTHIKVDAVTLDRQLLIFSFASVRDINNRIIKHAFLKLSQYAKANECRAITGYVADDRLINLYVNEFNADDTYKYIEVPL